MLITAILILSLQLVKYGNSSPADFLEIPNWSSEKSCKQHPHAISADYQLNLADPTIGMKCTLNFDYSTEPGNDDGTQFCRAMYPDNVYSAIPNKDKITCVYQRLWACDNDQREYTIGSTCVKILSDASTFGESKNKCKEKGFKLISLLKSKRLRSWFSRLYSFEHDSPAMWTVEDDKARLVQHKYSAIGSNHPGSEVKVFDETEKAVAVCVKEGDSLPGVKSDYCDMLKEFFKLKTFAKGSTCYSLTQSVMSGKKNPTDPKLVKTDHFGKICKAKYDDLDFPVAPRSDEQKAALAAAYEARGKRGVFLAAEMSAHFDQAVQTITKKEANAPQFSQKELFAALFRYKTGKLVKDINGTIENEIVTVPADTRWLSGYPTKSEPMGVTPGLLYYSDKKIMNVEQFRRAPIVCGAGPSVVTGFKCEDGWELARRSETEGFCMKVYIVDIILTWENALNVCIVNGADMAPMESEAEETAISHLMNCFCIFGAMGALFGFDHEHYGVMLGSKKSDEDSQYYWKMGGGKVGEKYPRWKDGEPNDSWIYPDEDKHIVGRGKARREDCLELAFYRARSVGLNEVSCMNGSYKRDDNLMTSVACAKKANVVTYK